MTKKKHITFPLRKFINSTYIHIVATEFTDIAQYVSNLKKDECIYYSRIITMQKVLLNLC